MVKRKITKIERLRKDYKKTRVSRNSWINTVKRFRNEMAKKTFADLDSRGQNPYFKTLRKKEKKAIQYYNQDERKLNRLDRKIDTLQGKRARGCKC